MTPIQVEAALVPELDRGFLLADLGALQRRVESLDWVEHVEIVRQWPDALVVRIVEHQAAARWGEMGLLNTHGELFANEARHVFPELPHLAGPISRGAGPGMGGRPGGVWAHYTELVKEKGEL